MDKDIFIRNQYSNTLFFPVIDFVFPVLIIQCIITDYKYVIAYNRYNYIFIMIIHNHFSLELFMIIKTNSTKHKMFMQVYNYVKYTN